MRSRPTCTFSVTSQAHTVLGYLVLLQQVVVVAPSARQTSALHHAAQIGDLSAVTGSLQAGGLDNKDRANETPLLKAARFGRTKVVAALLRAGAIAQVQHALPIAARYGHAEVVRLLLEAGAEPNVADTRIKYDTPLMLASLYGETDVVQVLLQGGARVNAQNRIGRTALICAAGEGHATTLAALLNSGAEVDLPDKKGHVPLIFACNGGHQSAVQLLLDRGANVHIPAGLQGSTALMIASMRGFLAITKGLLAAGADPNARADDCRAPPAPLCPC